VLKSNNNNKTTKALKAQTSANAKISAENDLGFESGFLD